MQRAVKVTEDMSLWIEIGVSAKGRERGKMCSPGEHEPFFPRVQRRKADPGSGRQVVDGWEEETRQTQSLRASGKVTLRGSRLQAHVVATSGTGLDNRV